jgi:FMN phosphatase YigB (HAD superfamily)
MTLALDRLGVSGRDAIYVGDDPEVDGVVAAAAGVRFVLVARREQRISKERSDIRPWLIVERLDDERLRAVVC